MLVEFSLGFLRFLLRFLGMDCSTSLLWNLEILMNLLRSELIFLKFIACS